MLIVDDENTTFEVNPLGNRQRLLPRDSFRARNAGFKPALEEASMVVDDSMLLTETVDESLSEGMFTMSDVVLPANAMVHAPIDDVALPSLLPRPHQFRPAGDQASGLMLLPKEIAYAPQAEPYYYPITETHTALPIASRRVRYLAVPILAVLALVVLGGAVMPPDVEALQGPAASVAATAEATSAPKVFDIANEPPAPAEVIEPVVVKKPVVRISKRARKVTVNASSALGNLRPGRAF